MQFVFIPHQLIMPDEYQHLIRLGCKTSPSFLLCAIVRNYVLTYHMFPGIEELAVYHYNPCHDSCEHMVPMEDALPILIHGMIEYGVYLPCHLVYTIHVFQFLNNRFPRADEIELHSSQPLQDTIHNSMSSQVDEFWNSSQSGLDLTRFPAYVLDRDTDSCAICLEQCKQGQSVIRLSCQHVFHSKTESCNGIETWLSKINTCPLCKYQID